MGGWQQWDEVERLLPARQVYVDTAFSMSYLGERRFCRLVEAFGAEHVLFGSDGPWGDVTAEVARLRAMPLSDDNQEAILWRTRPGCWAYRSPKGRPQVNIRAEHITA